MNLEALDPELKYLVASGKYKKSQPFQIFMQQQISNKNFRFFSPKGESNEYSSH